MSWSSSSSSRCVYFFFCCTCSPWLKYWGWVHVPVPLESWKVDFYTSSERSDECQPSSRFLLSPTLFQAATLIYSTLVTQTYLPNRKTWQWTSGRREKSCHLSPSVLTWLSVCVCSVRLTSRDLLSHQWAQLADGVQPSLQRGSYMCVSLFLHVCCSSVQCMTGDLQKGKIKLVPLCHILSQTLHSLVMYRCRGFTRRFWDIRVQQRI